MSALDVVDSVAEVLSSFGIEAHTKPLDAFTGNEGVTLSLAGTKADRRDQDFVRHVTYNIHVVSRHYSEDEAAKEIFDIYEKLDGVRIPSLGHTYTWISTDTLPPHPVGHDGTFNSWETRIDIRATKD